MWSLIAFYMEEKILKELYLPVIPLRELMIFPNTALNFDVGRAKTVKAVELAMAGDRQIFLATQKDGELESVEFKDLYPFGIIGQIQQVLNLPGNNLRVLVSGIKRGELKSLKEENDSYYGDVREIQISTGEALSTSQEIYMKLIKEAFQKYIELGFTTSPELLKTVKRIKKPELLVDTIASSVMSKMEDRQLMLQIENEEERLFRLYKFLEEEVERAKEERLLRLKVRMHIDKNQREYVLREQLKAIHEELGDEDENNIQAMREKVEKLPMNKEAKEKALKEIDRLERTSQGSPEYAVSENYLDWLLNLPWGKKSKDKLNLKRARNVLDQEHYGLEKVKKRIIEYLAVQSIRAKNSNDKAMRGSILCFVGPPGVGKTSIVKAIAKAMGREFIQMSLGGIRDEAEICGHRKTYIGAMPGRIISGLKQAKVSNPLFLFDEIDKMRQDFRGDPASAMLEVLDSDQNNHFRDHYLDVPFDLSEVLFVTTANYVENIPAPLLDRMELIEVSSYTEEEKLQIAKKHLLRRQIAENGLKKDSVKMSEAVLKALIEGYTREAGVRTLTRQIGAVVRKAAVEMLDSECEQVVVDKEKLISYLGAPRFIREDLNKESMVGVVNGLAFTQVGGEMLQIEGVLMPGTGKLSITGQIGDVMKESAEAALSWVRAHSKEYEIDESLFKTMDIHIHVPEGAVPKDGPSAGVTMLTTLVSIFTKTKVDRLLAMTGEITLTGRVLPIGGVKEKLLAAFRAGIKRLCLPEENRRDVDELPEYIRNNFEIHYVKEVDELLKIALLKGEENADN